MVDINLSSNFNRLFSKSDFLLLLVGFIFLLILNESSRIPLHFLKIDFNNLGVGGGIIVLAVSYFIGSAFLFFSTLFFRWFYRLANKIPGLEKTPLFGPIFLRLRAKEPRASYRKAISFISEKQFAGEAYKNMDLLVLYVRLTFTMSIAIPFLFDVRWFYVLIPLFLLTLVLYLDDDMRVFRQQVGN